MDREEKILANKRKRNMDLYSIHRMLTADLLFYYAIKFIFLTQVKALAHFSDFLKWYFKFQQ